MTYSPACRQHEKVTPTSQVYFLIQILPKQIRVIYSQTVCYPWQMTYKQKPTYTPHRTLPQKNNSLPEHSFDINESSYLSLLNRAIRQKTEENGTEILEEIDGLKEDRRKLGYCLNKFKPALGIRLFHPEDGVDLPKIHKGWRWPLTVKVYFFLSEAEGLPSNFAVRLPARSGLGTPGRKVSRWWGAATSGSGGAGLHRKKVLLSFQ